MKFFQTTSFFALAASSSPVAAFRPSIISLSTTPAPLSSVIPSSWSAAMTIQQPNGSRSRSRTCLNLASNLESQEDCGCASVTEFAGKPNERAKFIDHRQAIREHTIQDVQGKSVQMDDLIGSPDEDNQVSIVVFLRSLG